MPDFHLGFSPGATKEQGPDPLTIDSSDLTTHAVVVGMTGSGKTGLGLCLLEEALLAGVPVLALDPKGDLGNLCLTFPDLAPASFRPWIDQAAATRDGLSLDEAATQAADRWREGLAGSGIDPERIAALREAADVTIYTPGSEAGVPLNVIGSLAAPALPWETESETLREEIEGTVTSLLGLVGIESDPLSSREHVLLSNIIETAWRGGISLDLAGLITQVQSPPFRRLGVFELDTFFPEKDRTQLALKLNALIASPTFAAWTQGPPLDPQSLLFDSSGKPRAAIVYLAHLSETERQFVVTLVLSKVVTWMRGLAGTSDLRALVYMDEVYGYVPPTAMPPPKKPILTILKQARAFGVGMTLATQNPVDLDYKAMSNAGTWLVGRLQTENDKARVLEGLRSAAGGADIDALDRSIGALEKRQFLLVSAHDPEPRVFGTRWAMSYLRGPLTKEQVGQLMGERKTAPPVVSAPAAPASEPTETVEATGLTPVVADGVPVYHVDPAAAWAGGLGAVPAGTTLRPAMALRVALRYDERRADVDHEEEWEAIALLDGPLDLDEAIEVDYDERDFRTDPPADAVYAETPAPIDTASFFKQAAADVKDRLIREREIEIYRNTALKLYSRPGETEESFAERCREAADEEADEQVAKIRDRLESKRDRLERALEDARRRAADADAEAASTQKQDLLSGAGAVLGSLLGGRSSSRDLSRLGRALGGSSGGADRRAASASAKADDLQDDLADLEQEIIDEVDEITAKWDETAAEIEPVSIRLESDDVKVIETALLWIPGA